MSALEDQPYADEDLRDEEEIVDDQGVEEGEDLQFRYKITSYGADFPVDGLVRRIKDGSIYIPEFQRGFVWSLPRASRFVESLSWGCLFQVSFCQRSVIAESSW